MPVVFTKKNETISFLEKGERKDDIDSWENYF